MWLDNLETPFEKVIRYSVNVSIQRFLGRPGVKKVTRQSAFKPSLALRDSLLWDVFGVGASGESFWEAFLEAFWETWFVGHQPPFENVAH
jgi:hypothetical protein